MFFGIARKSISRRIIHHASDINVVVIIASKVKRFHCNWLKCQNIRRIRALYYTRVVRRGLKVSIVVVRIISVSSIKMIIILSVLFDRNGK